MTEQYGKIEGKSMSELMRLVAADNARFDLLEKAWHDLTEREQNELVAYAQNLVAGA